MTSILANRRPRGFFNRSWRVLATGYCFAFFGLAAIVVSCTAFPYLHFTSRNAEEGRARIQRCMSFIFRVFVKMMRVVGVISYELHGIEKLLKPGQLVVANHPTLIDVVFLVSLMPHVDCIVKEGLWRNPFLRWPVAWAGYIPNSTAEQLIESCATSLKSGRSLLVFPEGTRTVPEQPLNMRRGAAQIALAAGVDIRPVTILCEPLMLAKTQPWYSAPYGPGHFVISVGEPLPASRYAPEGVPQSVAARALTRRFVEYFTGTLQALRAGRKVGPALQWPSEGEIRSVGPAPQA
jgi:1-acyl-sn-glycerol-3-phosphate acyltransferase